MGLFIELGTVTRNCDLASELDKIFVRLTLSTIVDTNLARGIFVRIQMVN
jgi:hypothetical protein